MKRVQAARKLMKRVQAARKLRRWLTVDAKASPVSPKRLVVPWDIAELTHPAGVGLLSTVSVHGKGTH